MSAHGSLARITIRANRTAIAIWVAAIVAFIAALPEAYAYILTGDGASAFLSGVLGDSAVMAFIFGKVPDQLTTGGFLQWEAGTYTLIAVAIMAVLLTTAARREEDLGQREMIPTQPNAAIFAASIAPALAATIGVTLGIFIVLAAQSAMVDGLPVSGSAEFAVAIGLQSLFFVAFAALANQVARDGTQARMLAGAGIAIAFGIRAVAEGAHHPFMRWFTPFGWKDIVAPFGSAGWGGADRGAAPYIGAFAIMLAACVLVGVVAWRLSIRRELMGGLLRLPVRTAAPLPTRSLPGLVAWTTRHQIGGWIVLIVALNAMFGFMAHSMLQVMDSPDFETLMAAITGVRDPAAQYMALCASFLGILTLFAGVQVAARAGAWEDESLLDAVAASGQSRGRIVGSFAAVGVGLSVLLPLLGGAALAGASMTALGWDQAQYGLWESLAAIPGAWAVVGITLLAYAVRSSWRVLGWIPVVWSAVVAWFGEILRFPDWLMKVTCVGWSFDPHGSSDVAAFAVLTALAAVSVGVGLVVYRRRDVG